ncbi:nuclear transport factor 2 family protein [Zoogloea sp.]|uniref:nuclear transport factor 2 family protein n=1 Tax=Zoogloea sp. TaxID=49181 RepID=UPI0031FDEF34
MNSLLALIQALEIELHHSGVRCDAARLGHVLHEDFHEIGRSGSRYDRATVMGFLAGLKEAPPAVSDDFVLQELAPGVVLLNYRSADVQPGGALSRHTLRSSIWVREGDRWQIRYHQGTPAAAPW